MRSLNFKYPVIIVSIFVILFIAYGFCFARGEDIKVEIIAVPTTDDGTTWHLEPLLKHLKEPLKFHWYFGDGEESTEEVPKPHYYEYGRCNVVLEVMDGDGRKYTASTTIDVEAG